MNKIQKEINRIIDWMQHYRHETDCKGIVVGVSGGKDSTVVAMLAKKVWGDDVYGVIMPNGVQSDLDDAICVCQKIGMHYRVVNIGIPYCDIINQIENSKLTSTDKFFDEISPKALTNIAPRIRMMTLYAIAQTLGYRVIGTSNRSERFIGWFTKWGDNAHDFNPIAHLTCTEVVELGKELAKEFNLPLTLIEKTPADGITGKSDEENFGFTYTELDKNLIVSNFEDISEKTIQMLKLHSRASHKVKLPYTITDWEF